MFKDFLSELYVMIFSEQEEEFHIFDEMFEEQLKREQLKQEIKQEILFEIEKK